MRSSASASLLGVGLWFSAFQKAALSLEDEHSNPVAPVPNARKEPPKTVKANAKTDKPSGLQEDIWMPSKPPASQGVPRPAPDRMTFMECIDQTLSRLRAGGVDPSRETLKVVNPRKLPVASQLAEWMEKSLANENAQVAIVARQGGLMHQKYDKTGMLHTGIAMLHPREKQWRIYNLVDTAQRFEPSCDVQWADAQDFFSQQGGYRQKSMLLIPEKSVQAKMKKALLNGDYKKLAFTTNYNMLSRPDSTESLNCNKWTLLNVLAAQKDDYKVENLLKEVEKNYEAGGIDVHPGLRPFAGIVSGIRSNELPWLAPIQTVTVESLCQSGLFEKIITCDEPGPSSNKIAH